MPPFDLDRLQTQDEKEWDAFFRFFETRLYHFARRYAELIIDETAQDIVQETLLTAYEEICRKKNPLKEGGRYLSTWVFGICKNRCRDYVKVQRARQQKNEELQEDDILTLHPSAPTGADADQLHRIQGLDDCLECLPAGELRALVLECLGVYPNDAVEALIDSLEKTSPPLKAVLLLRYIVGLKYREIATTLDISLEAVKGRLYDAIPPFRQRMKKLYANEEIIGG